MTKQYLICFALLLSATAFAQVQSDRALQFTGTGTNAKIEGIQSVSANTDAANKQYVDTALASRIGVASAGGLSVSGTGAAGNPYLFSLPNTGTAATYGSATQTPVFTTDAKGRVTAVTNTTISGTAPGGAAGGDLSGTYPNPTIANNAVTSAKIADGTIAAVDLSAMSATTGQVLKYNGTAWSPATDNNAGGTVTSVSASNGLTSSGGNTPNISLGGALTAATTLSGLTATNKMSFSGTGVDAFNVDGTTLSVDATNDRVGIGTASPLSKTHIDGPLLTSFTGTGRGLLTLSAPYTNLGNTTILGNANTVFSGFLGIDFPWDNGAFGSHTNPGARIAVQHTAGGSFMHFGTSNNYTNGVTNQAILIDPVGNIGLGITPNLNTRLQLPNNTVFRLGDAFLSSGTGTNYVHLSNSSWWNGGAWTHSGTAGVLMQFTGQITNFYRISATGGFTTDLTLDAGNLTINGTATKPNTSTWNIASDERLKAIDGNYSKGLKEILALNPITYHYKNVGERKFNEDVLKVNNVGFSAQEVQKVFPEAVGVDADGYLNLNIHAILVAYVNAFKEQQQQIQEQQQTITQLGQENTRLKNSISIKADATDVKKLKAEINYLKEVIQKAEK